MGLIVTAHTNRYVFKEGHLLRKRLGVERENEIVPLRELMARGVKVTLSTDNVPVSLFHPVWHAVARRSRYVDDAIAPDQGLTREQALRCATANGAWLSFDEHKKGAIEPGKLADLAVLDADPLTVDEAGLKDISAAMTFVGGKLVYQKDST
jgi:predicted amidohydrolase YtcJ